LRRAKQQSEGGPDGTGAASIEDTAREAIGKVEEGNLQVKERKDA
jgi:hypothetical protein